MCLFINCFRIFLLTLNVKKKKKVDDCIDTSFVRKGELFIHLQNLIFTVYTQNKLGVKEDCPYC